MRCASSPKAARSCPERRTPPSAPTSTTTTAWRWARSGAAQQGRLDEAAALFAQAVAADPNLGNAWGALIRAELQLGRLAAAESSLVRAEAAGGLSPPSLHAHEALLDALAGRREAAER